MNAKDPSKKPLTIQECIDRLETLFKAYRNDSEFNYQLTACDSPFNQLKGQVTVPDLFLKALERGIYVKTDDGGAKFEVPEDLSLKFDVKLGRYKMLLRKLCLTWQYPGTFDRYYIIPIEGYGKTWAFTKEELECTQTQTEE